MTPQAVSGGLTQPQTELSNGSDWEGHDGRRRGRTAATSSFVLMYHTTRLANFTK